MDLVVKEYLDLYSHVFFYFPAAKICGSEKYVTFVIIIGKLNLNPRFIINKIIFFQDHLPVHELPRQRGPRAERLAPAPLPARVTPPSSPPCREA